MTCQRDILNFYVHDDQYKSAHVVCSLLDGLPNLLVQAILDIDDRRGFLEHTERLDQWWWETLSGTSDVEVL